MGENSNKSKHIEWIDLLRLFAIITVVICHSVEAVSHSLSLDYISSQALSMQLFTFSMFSIGRLGVPLFLMITGYLLIDREYDSRATKKFLCKNWLHLIICSQIWIFLYILFSVFFYKDKFDVLLTIERLLFVQPPSAPHFWYLPMIIGTYVTIPLISKALRGHDKKYKCFFFMFCSVLAFGFPTINLFLIVFKGLSISGQLSLGFSGGIYGLYIISGYLSKEGLLKKLHWSLLLLVGIASYVGAIYFQLASYRKGYVYPIWYDSILLLVMALVIFELFSRINNVYWYLPIRFLSKYSFALFLIHKIIIYVTQDKIFQFVHNDPLRFCCIFVVTYLLSIVVALAISLIPKVGKYILYIKQ